MTVPRWLVLMGLFAMLPAFAADNSRRYQVRAIDAVGSCKRLNSALVKAKTRDDWGELYGFSLYTMGYITGINRAASNTYDIAGKKNSKTLMVWLQQYCAEHPQDSFDQALYRLTIELYPDRFSVEPEKTNAHNEPGR